MRWPHQSILLALWIGVVNLAVLPGVTAGADERQRVYVGSETYQGCHEVQYAQFLANSNKVKSFDSIQKMQKKLTPAEFKECYACHTTGYGQPGGFTSVEEPPGLKNLGCEVCHGPGSLHAEPGEAADLAYPELIAGTVQRIQEGLDIVSQTGAAYAKSEERMTRSAELLSAIAAASKEQALGIEQNNKAVSEMDKATQDLAATAEELAASAGRFKVGSGSPPATGHSLIRAGALREPGPDEVAPLSEF